MTGCHYVALSRSGPDLGRWDSSLLQCHSTVISGNTICQDLARYGSMPENKLGYQDDMSILEFLRSSQGALTRLQVEHQMLLAQCQHLKYENLYLCDQNKKLLQDQEHLSAAHTNAEGKLSFRFRQVMDLEG
jgi:hypothetical protein